MQVNDKTSDVTAKLGKYYNQVYDKTDLNGQLHEWTKTLQGISQELTIIETQQINVLDSALKARIMHKIEPIQKSVEVLLGAAREDGLERKVKEVDEALQMELWKLLDKIGKLEHIKREQFDIIKRAIKDAQHFMDNGFDWDYRYKVLGMFEDIKRNVEDAHNALQKKKGELAGWVGKAQTAFKLIKNGVGLKELPVTSIDKKWTELKGYVTGIVEGLIGKEEGDTGDGPNGLLNEIENGLMNYGGGFDHKFKSAIGSIVKELVDEDKGEKGYLYTYVSENKRQRKFLDSVQSNDIRTILNQVTPKVISHITEKLQQHVENVNISDVREIEKMLDAVKRCVSNFSKTFSQHNELQHDTIATEIEAMFTSDPPLLPAVSSDSPAKPYLTQAVSTILTAVKSAAQRVKDELESITTDKLNIKYKLGKNVDEAIQKVESFRTTFGPTAGDIDFALNQVKPKIDELGEILEDTGITLKTDVDGLTSVLTALDNLKKENSGGVDGEINKKKKEADEKMNGLKTEIKYKLHVIEWNTRDADATLTQEIDAVENAIKESFQTLTSEVRTLFAQGHKADLAALKTLIEEQKEEIEKIIEKDKSNGVKGLLREIHDHNTTLDDMAKIAKRTVSKSSEYSKNFTELSDALKWYLDAILYYTKDLAMTTNPDKPSEKRGNNESAKLDKIRLRVDALLEYLKYHDPDRKYIFDHNSTRYLTELNESISSLSPSTFHGFHNPLLLDALKAGMEKFTDQLSCAYVNKYSGKRFGPLTEQDKTKKPADKVLSAEGRNCAKVCLTILERVFHDLSWLLKNCKENGNWRSLQINTYRDVPLGNFFQTCGYTVNSETGKQTGHLQDKACMTGQNIHELLFSESEVKRVFRHKDADKDKYGSLRNLHNYLDDYYYVTHLEYHPSPRAPSNIHQMLQWLLGLYYNPMFRKVTTYFNELFPKPKGREEVPYSDFKTTSSN
ncbi:hypothetical protein, conserved [Babesia ovata]|uniref:Extracellular matrix-binding ebh n=1 Tax=Babesia ovata TaxID=189622 RepID=A0A2H6KJY5_9APIC|nr:uncharacterized protein BOVATA_047970 [Babesia ovata]GBE63304.1 hypothetical protein, conserved [Babesia ovata]